MPKRSGAPDTGDLVTLRPEECRLYQTSWPAGEPRLVVATRGIEIQVMRDLDLIWVKRDTVNVV